MDKQIGCVKAATQILGDKWTPQLLRIIGNEKAVRFCHLQTEVGGINPRTLAARLNDLEKNDIISRTQCKGTTRSEYCLTSKGRDLLPILQSMQMWSEKYRRPPIKIA